MGKELVFFKSIYFALSSLKQRGRDKTFASSFIILLWSLNPKSPKSDFLSALTNWIYPGIISDKDSGCGSGRQKPWFADVRRIKWIAALKPST
jgi:hypothetical protein